MVSAIACLPRSARATCSRHVFGNRCNILTEERRCKRRSLLAQGAASMRSSAPRLCTPLPAALPAPQSAQILRAACAKPAAQFPGDRPRVMLPRTCVFEELVSRIWASSAGLPTTAGELWRVRRARSSERFTKCGRSRSNICISPLPYPLQNMQ